MNVFPSSVSLLTRATTHPRNENPNAAFVVPLSLGRSPWLVLSVQRLLKHHR